MTEILKITPADATKKPLRMPQERFSQGGWLLWYPPFFEHAYLQSSLSGFNVI